MSNEEKKVIEMEDTQVSEEATEITAVSESKGQKVRNFIKKNGKKLGIGVGATCHIPYTDAVLTIAGAFDAMMGTMLGISSSKYNKDNNTTEQ